MARWKRTQICRRGDEIRRVKREERGRKVERKQRVKVAGWRRTHISYQGEEDKRSTERGKRKERWSEKQNGENIEMKKNVM